MRAGHSDLGWQHRGDSRLRWPRRLSVRVHCCARSRHRPPLGVRSFFDVGKADCVLLGQQRRIGNQSRALATRLHRRRQNDSRSVRRAHHWLMANFSLRPTPAAGASRALVARTVRITRRGHPVAGRREGSLVHDAPAPAAGSADSGVRQSRMEFFADFVAACRILQGR